MLRESLTKKTKSMNNSCELAKEQICSEVRDRLDYKSTVGDEEIYSLIDDVMVSIPERWNWSLEETLKIRQEAFNSLLKYDALQEYLEDDEVTEIMINGKDAMFIEKNGTLIKTGKRFDSENKLRDIIQQMVSACNRTVNEANPIVDARLPDTGERVSIVLPPIALNGPIVTIRRFPKNPITMDFLEEIGSISKEASSELKELVKAKYNIFISGGTGSGKTTFLNALSQYIPPDERIITIEDSAELRLISAQNLVTLETRNKNFENCEPITIRDLIKTSLRMRPERIIVGEVRGPEALDMLQAMNTGHDGSLSTGHANSTKDMISRLETMVLMGMDIPVAAIRNQIASGIDIFVHLGRLRDRSRKVLQISEVVGVKNGEIVLNTIYSYDNNRLVKVGRLMHDEKLVKNGS